MKSENNFTYQVIAIQDGDITDSTSTLHETAHNLRDSTWNTIGHTIYVSNKKKDKTGNT
jgi:hypothetical protein